MNISVIIPTWNRKQVLSRAIDSVLAQTFPATEIIVIDDGSDDGTADLVRNRYPEVQLLSQSNAGVSSARNQGISVATGEWIALLDSDDEWLNHKLEKQQQAISDNPEYRICHSDEIWIRNGIRVNPKKKHQKRGGWIFDSCLPLCAISPSAVLLKKELFDEYGVFDESLPACEDYDLWLRLCSREPVLFVDELLLKKYGGHQDQLSQKHWGMDRFRLFALAKILQSQQLDDPSKVKAREQLTKKLTIFVAGARKRNNFALAEEMEKRYLPLTFDS